MSTIARFAAIILAVVVVGVGCTAADDDSSNGEQTETTTQEVFAIGDTAHTGDFDVTVHAIEDPFTEGLDIIQPTGRFVAVEATVTNTSDKPQPFSTLVGMELRDNKDRPFNVTISGSQRPSLDEITVPPNQPRRGWVVFDVPTDAAEFTLRVKGNLTATGSLFKLS